MALSTSETPVPRARACRAPCTASYATSPVELSAPSAMRDMRRIFVTSSSCESPAAESAALFPSCHFLYAARSPGRRGKGGASGEPARVRRRTRGC